MYDSSTTLGRWHETLGLWIKEYRTSSLRSHQIAPRSFEALANQQGVTPIDDFEALLGKPSAEDESAEEFAGMLRQWRRELTGADSSQ
jgi:hypothetical protein